MHHARVFVAALSLAAFATACGSDATSGGTVTDSSDTASDESTISAGTSDSSVDDRLDRAAEALKAGDFTTMLRLLELSGIADEVEGHEITILAPTDSAFTDISSDDFENLLTNPTRIDDVLKRHVIDELLTYDELASMTEVTTLSGDTLTVSNDGGELTVDGAVVSPPEADAASGETGQELAVFGIDRVLLEGS